MSKLDARIERLEAALKHELSQDRLIFMNDREVRITTGGKHHETETFPTVQEAAETVEALLQKFDNSRAWVSVEDVSQLFGDEYREAMQAAFMEHEERGAALLAFTRDMPIARGAFGAWLKHSYKQALILGTVPNGNKGSHFEPRPRESLLTLAVLADALNVPTPELTEAETAQLFAIEPMRQNEQARY